MNFWQMAKVMSNYQISGLPWSPHLRITYGEDGGGFLLNSRYDTLHIAFMDGLNNDL